MHFRELVLWQKAMALAKGIYSMAHLLPREETYGMRSQITRAVASVAANIAEGWTRESQKEKANFLSIAQGSLAETETFLILCEEIGWFEMEQTKELHGLIEEVGKMLSSLRRKLREG